MKLRILVIDQEQSLRQLLKTFLVQQGHEVEVYNDPSVCPLYPAPATEGCCCTKERACADVIFAGVDTPKVNAIEFFKLQRLRGCKLPAANKAVMSNYLTSSLDNAISALGCHHIGKPFRLTEIREWVDGCRQRLTEKKNTTP